MLLGCIGDDFTGSSDLANTLCKQGMRTVQFTGVPDDSADPAIDAGVIALKSRSIEPEQAIAQSLRALDWLQAQGCRQFLFKYCSTFDSTDKGNIGPVADALANALDAHQVVVCPAFPGTGRSVYQGHLFVNDKLLSESGMQNHPQTPMHDADLRRVLARQSQNSIGHVSAHDVFAGAKHIQSALEREHKAGHRLIVVDATRDEDLMNIGAALSTARLISGGSGIALGLPENFIRQGLLKPGAQSWTGDEGPCAVLSGSCSVATRKQVQLHQTKHPAYELSATAVLEKKVTARDLARWAIDQKGIPLIYSSAEPEDVQRVHAEYGQATTSEALDRFFAELATELVNAGVSRLISAGGETSGAIVEGLSLGSLQIGPEIDPGVPALRASDSLVLALKSGNFGAPNFFEKAAAALANSH